VERDRTFRSLASGFLHNVFDGATDQYLLHALEDKRLSQDELERLEEMIAEAKARLPAASKRNSKRST
jgi:predicted transcriptional regulator